MRYQSCKELRADLANLFLDEKEIRLRKVQKEKRKQRMRNGLLCFLLFTGLFFGVWHHLKTVRYERYLSVAPATDDEERRDAYESAIALFPRDPRAYLKLLEYYEEKGCFTSVDSDALLSVYNTYAPALSGKGNERAKVYYRMGRLYFHLYESEDDGGFSGRVQKAYPFFEEALAQKEEGFCYETMLRCDAAICRFYKDYILNRVEVSEYDAADYETLLEEIRMAKKGMRQENVYERLSLDHGIFCLLYDQRDGLYEAGIPAEEVLFLFDEAVEDAGALLVKKEVSKRLQSDILTYKEVYRQALERAFQI